MTIPTRGTISNAPALRLCVFVLLAAVLAWGIGYKVSLYAASSTSGQTAIPPARLLAHRICLLNRGQRASLPDFSAPASVPVRPFSLAVPANSLAAAPCRQSSRVSLPAEPRTGSFFVPAFPFSRPPPVAA